MADVEVVDRGAVEVSEEAHMGHVGLVNHNALNGDVGVDLQHALEGVLEVAQGAPEVARHVVLVLSAVGCVADIDGVEEVVVDLLVVQSVAGADKPCQTRFVLDFYIAVVLGCEGASRLTGDLLFPISVGTEVGVDGYVVGGVRHDKGGVGVVVGVETPLNEAMAVLPDGVQLNSVAGAEECTGFFFSVAYGCAIEGAGHLSEVVGIDLGGEV